MLQFSARSTLVNSKTIRGEMLVKCIMPKEIGKLVKAVPAMMPTEDRPANGLVDKARN